MHMFGSPMRKRNITLILLLFIFVLSTSGCLDFFQDVTITYEPHAVKINYHLRYGYRINTTGSGRYSIDYRCDLPEVLMGNLSYDLLYAHEYEESTLVNNSLILWNISGHESKDIELGITALVEAESLIEPDLNGTNALSLMQIEMSYPEVLKKYGNPQANETIVLIDPTDQDIQVIASFVKTQAETNNSFLLAKSLFIWLKENIQYQVHDGQGNVQPASITLQEKSGDCDDLSFLYLSLCRAIGIPARFIRGYLLDDTGSKVTATPHAWTEVFVGGDLGTDGWIPVECACCTPSIDADIHQNFGVENAFHLRLFVDDGSNESLITSLSGILYSFVPTRHIDIQPFAEIVDYEVVESKKLVVKNENFRVYE